mmetsp:Transcript_25287/g.28122  ORF Transcript_25287/g.28122 Transcript_25287/m.28122 type:complete len:533 (-) Transcript_25287:33-1631(-)
MSQFLNPGIILLKEGTEQLQGIPHVVGNINACEALVDTIKTTLGPCGMDKLIYGQNNDVTISNDGATIMKKLDIVHPAAKTLVEIAKSQDDEVGDGTTSVVIIAGSLLSNIKKFLEDKMSPQVIIRAYRKACDLAKKRIKELAVPIDKKDPKKFREMLINCAATALNSKLVSTQREFFAEMIVDAVMKLGVDLDLDMVGVKKETGGSLTDSFLVDGVAFKKTFAYAGFEEQPKQFKDPKILLLNVELELKNEKDNARVEIENPEDYQDIVNAEWEIIYEKLDNCIKSGAQIVLSRLAIGDLATQYFADRGVFCAGRVPAEDLKRVSKATGGKIQATCNNIPKDAMGTCGLFEERQVGKERYNIFTEAPESKTATLVLRGGGEEFVEEAARSLHDSIMVVRRAVKHSDVVAGGGAIEMEISKYLLEYALTLKDKQQLIIAEFGQALEAIPRQLAINSGYDSTLIMNHLRKKHQEPEGQWFGVDVNKGFIADMYKDFVWEPALIRLNAITAATEAACVILSIDQTVKSQPKQQQ